jgi:hypothetical protein
MNAGRREQSVSSAASLGQFEFWESSVNDGGSANLHGRIAIGGTPVLVHFGGNNPADSRQRAALMLNR